MLDRCLKQADDGRLFGYRGILKHSRTVTCVRTAQLSANCSITGQGYVFSPSTQLPNDRFGSGVACRSSPGSFHLDNMICYPDWQKSARTDRSEFDAQSEVQRDLTDSTRLELMMDAEKDHQLAALIEQWQCSAKKEAVELAIARCLY